MQPTVAVINPQIKRLKCSKAENKHDSDHSLSCALSASVVSVEEMDRPQPTSPEEKKVNHRRPLITWRWHPEDRLKGVVGVMWTSVTEAVGRERCSGPSGRMSREQIRLNGPWFVPGLTLENQTSSKQQQRLGLFWVFAQNCVHASVHDLFFCHRNKTVSFRLDDAGVVSLTLSCGLLSCQKVFI